MNFSPDCVSSAPCAFHSMSRSFILGSPLEENIVGDDAEWYFPNLARNDSTACETITGYVQDANGRTKSNGYRSNKFTGTNIKFLF